MLTCLVGVRGKSKIPYMFMTNFGGSPESYKAKTMTEKLNVLIKPEQLLLSHSPMKKLLAEFRDKLILVVGTSKELTDPIMKDYGFQKWVWYEDFLATHPAINPMINTFDPNVKYEHEDESFGAIFYMHEPKPNGIEVLQLMCDILTSDGKVTNQGFTRQIEKQTVKIFFANPDLFYSSKYNQPRMTVGTFASCLDHLYSLYSDGRKLDYTCFGKPHKAYFDMAEEMLKKQAPNVKRFYMIGDNPESDIRGANSAGDHWHSILVRTGVFQGEENDLKWPAKHVANHVLDAVKYALDREAAMK